MATVKRKRRARSTNKNVPDTGLGRVVAAVRNGLEIARHGGLTERQPAPYEVEVRGKNHRLRHYFPDRTDPEEKDRPAVLLIPPLMLTAEVWDVSPEASVVEILENAGADPWVVDFGSPEQEEGGLDRSLTDHVLAVAEAIGSVRKCTGRPVHVMGYSQGGMFAYQAVAFLRTEGVASVATFGSGVDFHQGLPLNLPPELVIDSIERLGRLQSALIPDGIPSWATRLGFQLMDPIKTAQQRIDFMRRLYDREALQKREGMRRFMETEGWTAFPGPALADVLKQLVAQNRLLQGGLVIDERTVTLADITCPILAFVGTTDSIAPPQTVRAIYAAAPQADCYQVKVEAGHFGLIVGSRANEQTWPNVVDWLECCEGRGPLPETAELLEEHDDETGESSMFDDLRVAAQLTFDLSADVIGGVARGLGSRIGIAGRMMRNVVPQAGRLGRLSDVRSGTRLSPGLTLLERAKEAPKDTFFLFEDRAHNYASADERIDNIVRGLIQCGVRPGAHVGVLMETRPSAVASLVAISRLGAVSVLLRPDLSLARQLEVAQVDHLLCDPERGEAARKAFGQDVLVLGGGGGPRELARGLVDMEAIDPAAVEVPDWYEPNPGLAGELAMVLITGAGQNLGTRLITNRRWATSAFGTATGCALTPMDTVYCCSPIHHPTGILVCVGGALVSGARLAMATTFSSQIDPGVFWSDVRRYGVNVVFYTGSMCHALVTAPRSQHERHHAIRLFAGSGMPKALWRRVVERFGPIDVVEFFASTEGNAVLVNLTGEKVGSLGRPLPGGGDVGIAAWNLEKSKLVESESGFAKRCRPGDVGLLVERIDRERGELEGRAMRGLFEAGDAWLSTRDLVRIDDDGDYWQVDYITDVIRGVHGAVATIPVEDSLAQQIEDIDLVAVYGVQIPGGTLEVPMASLVLRRGAVFDPVALRHAVEHRLRDAERPVVVRIVDTLPTTAGHRTRKRALRRVGFDEDAATAEGQKGEMYWLAPGEAGYVPFEREAFERMVASMSHEEQDA